MINQCSVSNVKSNVIIFFYNIVDSRRCWHSSVSFVFSCTFIFFLCIVYSCVLCTVIMTTTLCHNSTKQVHALLHITS